MSYGREQGRRYRLGWFKRSTGLSNTFRLVRSNPSKHLTYFSHRLHYHRSHLSTNLFDFSIVFGPNCHAYLGGSIVCINTHLVFVSISQSLGLLAWSAHIVCCIGYFLHLLLTILVLSYLRRCWRPLVHADYGICILQFLPTRPLSFLSSL